MKLPSRSSLIIISIILIASALLGYFLLERLPAGGIYLVAAATILIGFWQIKWASVRLSVNEQAESAEFENKLLFKYWAKRIALLLVLGFIAIMSYGLWWTQNIPIPKEEDNKIASKLPWQYAFKFTQWQLGHSPLPKLVKIPAGEFRMGSELGASDEKPVHKVKIPYDFYMSQTEVTFEQYDYAVWHMQKSDLESIYYPDDKKWGRDKQPVMNVSWHNAQAYSYWLSKQTGMSCRLPSEAEWEYSARAGTTTKYFWGDDIGKNQANCNECGSEWDYQQTAPVGSFKPNQLGLQDMHGNVWEWTQDCWHDDYQGAPNDGSVWESQNKGNCARRVLRGGSWLNGTDYLRSANRDWDYTEYRDLDVGFRIVCVPPLTDG